MSVLSSVAALEDRVATGRCLRVEFFRMQGRYAHRILAVGCEELPVLLLESVEGTAEDLWPPSPAFQALNLEELKDCDESSQSTPAAMLVGMSGSTHWSMTVGSLSKDSHEPFRRQTGFHFDVAGRLKSPPKVLSTRYLVGKRVQMKRTDDGMMLHFGSGQAHLNSRSNDGADDPNGWQLANRWNELRHELTVDLSQLQLPATIRWGYSLQLLSD